MLKISKRQILVTAIMASTSLSTNVNAHAGHTPFYHSHMIEYATIGVLCLAARMWFLKRRTVLENKLTNKNRN